MATEFERAMRLMHSRDPQEAEEGFHDLAAIAPQYVDELIEAFEREPPEGMRPWLLELLGCHTGSDKALATLTAALYGDNDVLRTWALHGLRALDTKESRRLLWQWRQNQPGV